MQTEKKPNPEESNHKAETDASKLTAVHMADQHHVISDEEMQNIRIGVDSTPPNPQQLKEEKKANEDLNH